MLMFLGLKSAIYSFQKIAWSHLNSKTCGQIHQTTKTLLVLSFTLLKQYKNCTECILLQHYDTQVGLETDKGTRLRGYGPRPQDH